MMPVRDLHNDLLKPVREGGFEHAYTHDDKVLISNTMLRALMPADMWKMTKRYKQSVAVRLALSAEVYCNHLRLTIDEC